MYSRVGKSQSRPFIGLVMGLPGRYRGWLDTVVSTAHVYIICTEWDTHAEPSLHKTKTMKRASTPHRGLKKG